MNDFRLEDLDSFDLLSAEKVANKYGGDKRKIGEAAQMGLINPTVAVMAGMFIDRMRNAAIKEQQSDTTVAQDVMAPAPQMAGLGATPQAQTAPQMAPQANTQMAAAPSGTVPLAKGGLSSLPVDEDMFPDEYAGGGIVAFARGDLVGQGVNEPFEGESYGAYLMRRAKESLRGPFFSEEGTMPRAGMSESQADFYNQGRTNQALLGDILSGKAPVPVRSADPTLMREATPPGYYADETTRGTARRVAEGGPGRALGEFGVGATERRDAEEAAKKAGAAKGAAPAKEETSEDFLARRKRMLKEAGVSEDPFGADRAAAKTRADEIAAQRKENQAISMIMGGLSGIGARNLAEFAQKAGTAGFGQYMKGEKEAREDQKEIDKINRDLSKAEDALKRGDVDKALEFEDKAAQRQIQLRGVQAQERSAARPTSTAELMAGLQSPDPAVRRAAETVLGAAKTGQVDERFLMERWDKMDRMEKFKLAQQGIGYEQWAAGKRAGAAGGVAPAAGGRVIDFGSIR
jgi:hypothetical protein